MPDEEMERPYCKCCGVIFRMNGEGTETADGLVCTSCIIAHYKKCDYCEEWVKKDKLKDTVDGGVCDNCLDNHYCKCYRCNEYYNIDDMHEGSDGNLYCEDCFENLFFTCDSCGGIGREEDAHTYDDDVLCYDCYRERTDCDDDDDDDENTELREPVHPEVRKAWRNKKKKKIITFGIELETNSHFEPTHWFKRVFDGSIEGKEYVSAVLPYNKTGETIVNEFCKYARSEDGEVGSDCGYHVHLGGYQSSFMNMKKVWVGYIRMEKMFFSSMPKSRRNNRFCNRFTRDYSLETVIQKQNIAKLVSYYYSRQLKQKKAHPKDHYNEKRYYYVNFHSWLNKNTVELRLHSATLNEEKIINWLHINKLFLDWLTDKNTSLENVVNLTDKRFYKIMGKKLSKYIMNRISKFGIDTYEVVDINKKLNDLLNEPVSIERNKNESMEW